MNIQKSILAIAVACAYSSAFAQGESNDLVEEVVVVGGGVGVDVEEAIVGLPVCRDCCDC